MILYDFIWFQCNFHDSLIHRSRQRDEDLPRIAGCNAQIFNMKTLKSCVRHLAQMQKHYAKPADTDMNSTVYSDLKRDVDSCGKEVEDPPNKKYMLCLKKVSFELLFCFQYRARNHRNHQILDTPSFWMVPLCKFIKKNPQLFAQKTVPTANVLRRCPQLHVRFDGKAVRNRDGSNDADGKSGSPTKSRKNMKTWWYRCAWSTTVGMKCTYRTCTIIVFDPITV